MKIIIRSKLGQIRISDNIDPETLKRVERIRAEQSKPTVRDCTDADRKGAF